MGKQNITRDLPKNDKQQNQGPVVIRVTRKRPNTKSSCGSQNVKRRKKTEVKTNYSEKTDVLNGEKKVVDVRAKQRMSATMNSLEVNSKIIEDAEICAVPIYTSTTGEKKKIKKTRSKCLSKTEDFYFCMLKVMEYLNVSEVLQFAQTNRLFNRIALDSRLWQQVKMKNSKVTNWNGFIEKLINQGTTVLDLRKILTPHGTTVDKMWEQFLSVIPRLTTLCDVHLGTCTAEIVETFVRQCPSIKALNAHNIKSGTIDFREFLKLQRIHTLTLRSVSNAVTVNNNIPLALCWENLRILCITGVQNLKDDVLEAVSSMEKLQVLEIGRCNTFTKTITAKSIRKLKSLIKLRIEELNIDNDLCHEIFSAIGSLVDLKCLELINFLVSDEFSKAIAYCTNIVDFFIIPVYKNQVAKTNQYILGGIKCLKESLKCFTWGFPKEIFKMTDLFIKCHQGNKDERVSRGQTVAIMRTLDDVSDGTSNTTIDFLTIPELKDVLCNTLPHTKIEIPSFPVIAAIHQRSSKPEKWIKI